MLNIKICWTKIHIVWSHLYKEILVSFIKKEKVYKQAKIQYEMYFLGEMDSLKLKMYVQWLQRFGMVLFLNVI